MRYEYFDHEADTGIRAWGATLEEAFQECAQGMLDLIAEHEFRSDRTLKVALEAPDACGLLVAFLNDLLALMDVQDLFISFCRVHHIKGGQALWRLEGEALGVPRSKDVSVKTEVKAATYCQAAVVKETGGFRVQCVVDL